MDTTSLLKETKAKFNFNLAKVHLKEKYQNKLIIAEQGGLWKITPEMIAFASNMTDESIILIDAYENPVELNRTSFLSKILAVYNTAMQEYLAEWKTLKNIR